MRAEEDIVYIYTPDLSKYMLRALSVVVFSVLLGLTVYISVRASYIGRNPIFTVGLISR